MKTKIIVICAALLFFALVNSCKKEKLTASTESFSDTPILPEKPYNYSKSTNDQLAALGRVLFYDKNLSLNNSVACASCHQQTKAFCDNLQFSVGLEDLQTKRNSPSIVGKAGRMFWDGRSSSMQDLVLRPIKNHVEMKIDDIDALVDKISKISYYPELFNKAYGSVKIDSARIKVAVAEFLKNFDFSNNKFKEHQASQKELTASEKVGKGIFFGAGNCSKCHHIEAPPLGNFGYGSSDFNSNIGLDMVYPDPGFADVSKHNSDIGKFMVPVLLNVEYTAPYMHDGRFKTLEEVVEHYNSGLQKHPNLDIKLRDLGALKGLSDAQQIQAIDENHNLILEESELAKFEPLRLNLSSAEKKGLVDFLKTLSDPSIFTDVKFSSPFKK